LPRLGGAPVEEGAEDVHEGGLPRRVPAATAERGEERPPGPLLLVIEEGDEHPEPSVRGVARPPEGVDVEAGRLPLDATVAEEGVDVRRPGPGALVEEREEDAVPLPGPLVAEPEGEDPVGLALPLPVERGEAEEEGPRPLVLSDDVAVERRKGDFLPALLDP